MTYYLQHQVFLACCYQMCNKFRECVLQQCYNTIKLWQATEKLASEYEKSFSGATTNLHQQNPSMRSGIKLATIPYCTIYYLLYQEFPTLCVYP